MKNIEFIWDGGGICPEQYEIYVKINKNIEHIAYMRLRHGFLSVELEGNFKKENPKDNYILQTNDVAGMGCFDTVEEKEKWKNIIEELLKKEINEYFNNKMGIA